MRGYRIIERRHAAKLGYWRGPLKGIMYGFATLYKGCLAGWYASYKLHIAKVHKLPVPVISVGNITVGGSGKTPFVSVSLRTLMRKAAGRMWAMSLL